MHRVLQYRVRTYYEDQPGPSTVNCDWYCAFCKRSLNNGQTTRYTKCGHQLHVDCMDYYLSETKKCPVCGTKIRWINIKDKCVICLDQINHGEDIVTPNCKHEMHYDCLKQLFVTKSRCPICRKCLLHVREVISDSEDNEQSSYEVEDEQEESYEDQSYVDEEQQSYYEDEEEQSYIDEEEQSYVDEEEQSYVDEEEQSYEEEESYSEDENEGESLYKTMCYYCKESFAVSCQPQKYLKCGHMFHFRCINEHLPKTRKCGICYTPIYGRWINTNDKCVKCFQFFKESEQRFKSICHHELHKSCKSKIKNNRCPICRCKVESTTDECTICLETTQSHQDTFITHCKHKFHKLCIDDWRKVENICPNCRKPLPLY